MRVRIVAAIVAFALPALACAQIYTWKDSSGRIHYADNPPGGVDAKPLRGKTEASPRPTQPDTGSSVPSASASAPPTAKASGPKGWEERDRDFKQRQKEQAEADGKAKKEQESKAEKERYCSDLRRNLAMLERGGRIGQANEKGESIPMSDSQMQAEINRSKAQLAKDCK